MSVPSRTSPRPKVEQECQRCGKTFLARQCRIERGDDKYCGIECYRNRSPEERFWVFVNKDGPVPEHRPDLGPCWVWTGNLRKGYGRFRFDGKGIPAHQFLLIRQGRLPVEGHVPDHLCRNPACVNPDHIEVVTKYENFLRGESPSAIAVRTGLCARGHRIDIPGSAYEHGGRRICRTCASEQGAIRHQKRKVKRQ